MPLAELNKLSARALAGLVARREISPVEIIRCTLDRVDEVEAELNAFTYIARDEALAAARRAESAVLAGERLGPLHGVPVSVKDLIDVEGMPARYGSLTLKDRVATDDAPSAARLLKAGAIFIGKTTTSEFGYRGYTKSLVHGNTRNPWNLDRTPGGSSGGAVASVAAGVTPIALGTDGGGSIRAPCAFTGLTGVKPNFGRIPVWPASATPTLAHVGPIARGADDAGLVLSVVAGPDHKDAFSLLEPIGTEPDSIAVRDLRVAFSPTLGYAKVDRPVADIVARAVKLSEGVFPQLMLVETVCPDPAEILAAEFIGGCSARLGDTVHSAPDLIDPPLLAAIKEFRKTGADRYTRLLRQRLEHRETLRRFFERFDLLLTPTTPCVAWDINQPLPSGHERAAVWSYFTYPFNLSGQPAASLPCGLDPHGLPVGLQVVAPLGAEAMLMAALRAIEPLMPREFRTPVEPRRLPR